MVISFSSGIRNRLLSFIPVFFLLMRFVHFEFFAFPYDVVDSTLQTVLTHFFFFFMPELLS